MKNNDRSRWPNLCIALVFSATLSLFASESAKVTVPQLIPQPVSLTLHRGEFTLGRKFKIGAPNSNPEAIGVARQLATRLGHAFGREIPVKLSRHSAGHIQLELNAAPDATLGDEGYRLTVTRRGVRVLANQPAGLFYGTQTLLQLMPPDVESVVPGTAKCLKLPCVEIVDYPRFAWRGLLLDVSRHFFTKAEVERFIDEMARYKFNVFHWHLTDDQGWRVEIKKYPKLTSIGAWRVPRQGIWWTFAPPQPGEAATEGGFYTQDDIREIVAYARKRFVNILPEIEMPGHCLAALAAYPELSCTGGPFTVNPGSKFYGEVDNTFCVGQKRTFQFIDDVVGELAPLFPFAYFHIGGDEVFHKYWNKCPRCQATCQEHDLANYKELQSYFVKRVEKILEAHGKKLIGWDEILMGGLSPNATVMSWRGIRGGINAAKQNHDVVMTPSPYYYLDLYQGDPLIEPNAYSLSTLKMVYDFEPVPPGINPKRILGVQGNLWTESVPTFRHAQYMTWPRALAIAETGWTPARLKSWPDFAVRVEHHMERFRAADWNFAPSLFDAMVKPTLAADVSLRIALSTEMPGLQIHYTFTVANPDEYYPKYVAPLKVPPGASELRVVTTRAGKVIGRQINFPISELLRRVKKK
jgi:hexosaminidase